MSDDLADGYYWWSTGERWVMLCFSDGQWWSNDMPVDPPLPDDQLVAVPNAARIRELEALVEEARTLVTAVRGLGLRELVAGWNGENLNVPYKPHDRKFSATIRTNCGTVYDIDAATTAILARMGERDDRA